MRGPLATVLFVSVCSCHHLAQPAQETGADVPAPSKIAVGDAMGDIARRVAAAGGEDYSRFVGVIDYPHLSRWFILKDGTCLRVGNYGVPAPSTRDHLVWELRRVVREASGAELVAARVDDDFGEICNTLTLWWRSAAGGLDSAALFWSID